MKTKLIIVGLLVAVFSFTAAFAFAATGDPWFVVKNKKGACKMIQAKDKTPSTIAGPFKTAKEAKAARGKACKKTGIFTFKPRVKNTDAKPVKKIKPKKDVKPEVKKPEVKPDAKPDVKEVKPEAKPEVK